MIKNQKDLDHTRAQLHIVKQAFAAFKKREIDPERYRLMAEPYLDQIEELERLIDEYLSRSESANQSIS